MKMIITKTVLAAAVLATAALAPLASASASDDLRIQVQFFDGRRDEGPRWDRGPDRDWGRDRGRDWGRDRDRDRGCASWMAEEKASRMGLRRAHVVDVNRRVVVVNGYDRGGPNRIIFANERGCPVVSR